MTVIYKDNESSEWKEESITLYEGNAVLIMIKEWIDEDDKEVWTMFSFWTDLQHMKNCLGLNKKEGYTENVYVNSHSKISKIRLNKKRLRYTEKIATSLIKAFDNLVIEIYSE